MKDSTDISPIAKKDLHDGLRKAVVIIENFGNKYWPIFERLEDELTVIERRESRLARFKQKDFE